MREKYSIFQEKGTKGSIARPGGFLVFRGKSGALVFAKRTAPIAPGNFMKDAAKALKPSDYS